MDYGVSVFRYGREEWTLREREEFIQFPIEWLWDWEEEARRKILMREELGWEVRTEREVLESFVRKGYGQVSVFPVGVRRKNEPVEQGMAITNCSSEVEVLLVTPESEIVEEILDGGWYKEYFPPAAENVAVKARYFVKVVYADWQGGAAICLADYLRTASTPMEWFRILRKLVSE